MPTPPARTACSKRSSLSLMGYSVRWPADSRFAGALRISITVRTGFSRARQSESELGLSRIQNRARKLEADGLCCAGTPIGAGRADQLELRRAIQAPAIARVHCYADAVDTYDALSCVRQIHFRPRHVIRAALQCGGCRLEGAGHRVWLARVE